MLHGITHYLFSFTSSISLKFNSFMRFRVLFELFQVQEQIFLPLLSSFRLVRMLKITTFKITGLNRLQFHIGFHQYKLYWVIWGQNISQMSFPSLADLTPQHIHSTNQHILNKKCNSLKLFHKSFTIIIARSFHWRSLPGLTIWTPVSISLLSGFPATTFLTWSNNAAHP